MKKSKIANLILFLIIGLFIANLNVNAEKRQYNVTLSGYHNNQTNSCVGTCFSAYHSAREAGANGFYWLVTNTGYPINVNNLEQITFKNSTRDMYCVSPKMAADTARGGGVYVDDSKYYSSLKCDGKNNSYECGAIHILKENADWETKLIAIRLLAAEKGRLIGIPNVTSGDGVWSGDKSYVNNVADGVYYCSSLKARYGNDYNCGPYWSKSKSKGTKGWQLYQKAVNLYLSARNAKNNNYKNASKEYRLFEATPVGGSGYQSYLFITSQNAPKKETPKKEKNCTELKDSCLNGNKNDCNTYKDKCSNCDKLEDECDKGNKDSCKIYDKVCPKKTCKDYKDECEKDPSSKSCDKYSSKECCDEIKKSCEDGNDKDCETYDKVCATTTNKCNLSDEEINSGVIVKNAQSGEKFNLDVWNKIKARGDKHQMDSYKKYCKCNCTSTSEEINSGACDLTSGGEWNSDVYNKLNDNIKESYNVSCPPCNFNNDKIACSGNGTCDDNKAATLKANYDESQLVACSSVSSDKSKIDKIYSDNNLNAICYEEYEINYREASITTGINTTLGLSRYLKFDDNVDKDLDNRVRVTTTKNCYVHGELDKINSLISKNEDGLFAKAPSINFEYNEGIQNEGFIDETAKGNISTPESKGSNVYKVVATKDYEYIPATEFHVGVLDGQFYAKDNATNDITLKFDSLVKEYKEDENIKMLGANGRVFPIKFTTQGQILDQIPEDQWGYPYTINISNYNMDDTSINKDYDKEKCKNDYSCKYIISKKECKKGPCACKYVCSKDNIPDSEKETSPYCSEVCWDESNESKSSDKEGISFTYNTISTDTILDKNIATSIGSNWLNTKGQDTLEKIKTSSQKGNIFDDDNATYTITLTSDDISKIKDEIKSSSYVNKAGINCDNLFSNIYEAKSKTDVKNDTNNSKTDIYYCTSDFIRKYATTEQKNKLNSSYTVYYDGTNYSAWK